MEAGIGHHASEERYSEEDRPPYLQGWDWTENRECDIEGSVWKKVRCVLYLSIEKLDGIQHDAWCFNVVGFIFGNRADVIYFEAMWSAMAGWKARKHKKSHWNPLFARIYDYGNAVYHKKNLKLNICQRNILVITKKFVILHPVWNKYQKTKVKTVDSNVEDLSDYGQKGPNG